MHNRERCTPSKMSLLHLLQADCWVFLPWFPRKHTLPKGLLVTQWPPPSFLFLSFQKQREDTDIPFRKYWNQTSNELCSAQVNPLSVSRRDSKTLISIDQIMGLTHTQCWVGIKRSFSSVSPPLRQPNKSINGMQSCCLAFLFPTLTTLSFPPNPQRHV